MVTPTVSLLVLRTAQLETSLAFYRALGMDFKQEQHGNGPMHYACETGSMVIELYPGQPGSAPDRKASGATMIGFRVLQIERVIEALQTQGAIILTGIQSSVWGQRAVIQDPDGRAIELSQLPHLAD